MPSMDRRMQALREKYERNEIVAEEIGDGRVEIAGHMLAFAQDGYAGCVSIETHWAPPDGDRESNTCRTFAGLVSILHEI